MIKSRSKKILISLIIPVFGVFVGWVTWVTSSIYSVQCVGEAFQEYKLQMPHTYEEWRQNQLYLRGRLDEISNKLEQYHIQMYERLLDIQQQLNQKKK